MTPNPSIRPATPADFDAWFELWQGYQRFYQTDIDRATTLTTWQRLLSDDEPMHVALAADGRRAVGLVHYIEHRSCWTLGNYMYLQDLFVEPDHRGRGVGRALIEHVYTEAAARACSRVWWLTHETNTAAMQLYDRIAARTGFVQYRKVL